ncbi:MAG: DUF3185 family protein [Planctomycetota bacterium]
MTTRRLLALVILAAGLIVLGIGWHETDSLADQTKHFFSGEYTDSTSWLLLIGAVATVLGIGGLVLPGPPRA